MNGKTGEMDKNGFKNANEVGRDHTVNPAPSYEEKVPVAENSKLLQGQDTESRNSWITGFIVSIAVLIVPMLSLLIIEDKRLFCEEFKNLITGRDIMILSISTLLSLINIKEWNISSKTRMIVLLVEIVIALVYGSFSVVRYLSGAKNDVVMIITNIIVVLFTGYCISLGYRKR